MIVKVPLDPQLVAYIQSERGDEPLQYSGRDHLMMTLFAFFRCRIRDKDPIIDPGQSFIAVELSDLLIRKGKTYIAQDAIEEFERIVRAQLIERMVETVYERRQNAHLRKQNKLKEHIEYAKLKFGLTEDILPYDTLRKRVDRFDRAMQAH